MTQYTISIIGNPAFDLIEVPNHNPTRILSGFVFNTAVVLAKIGLKVNIIAKVGKDSVEDFSRKVTNYGINISNLLKGKVSTGFNVIYDKKGNRTLRNLGDAGKIYESDIPLDFFESDAVLIGPLIQEIPPNTLNHLATNSSLSLFDPQGSLRKINGNKAVENIVIKDAKPLLQDIDILKLTGEEALLMANSKSIEDAPKILSKMGPRIVAVTFAEKGSIIYEDGELVKRIPAFPTNAIDPTGAGDVYAAGFIYEYLKTKDIVKSGFFASAAASFMVENMGIDYEINEKLIRQRMARLLQMSETS